MEVGEDEVEEEGTEEAEADREAEDEEGDVAGLEDTGEEGVLLDSRNSVREGERKNA